MNKKIKFKEPALLYGYKKTICTESEYKGIRYYNVELSEKSIRRDNLSFIGKLNNPFIKN